VREFVTPATVMLNLGAGPATGNPLRVLKGHAARVAGADIDPAVLGNGELDDARVFVAGAPIPYADDEFDLVLSDFVLEHIERPLQFMAEVRRVLRPGGSFFFRTPNRKHYVSIISRATPHWFHERFANRVRGLGEASHEPYPTFHRMNSRAALGQIAGAANFTSVELRMCEAEPSYLVFHPIAFMAGVGYERVVNRFDALAGIRADIFGRMVK
jgi:SAM-dependent methyltransferase